MLQEDPEAFLIFDKFQDVDDDVAGAGIRHDPLNLTCLMTPKLANVVVDGVARFTPELQAALAPRCSINDQELLGTQRLAVADRHGVAHKLEPLIERLEASAHAFIRLLDHLDLVSESLLFT